MKLPTITKLPSGAYRTRIYFDGKCVSITRSTEAEVIEAVLQAKREHATGIAIQSAPVLRLSVEEAVEQYIEARRATASPATIRGYETIKRTRFAKLMQMPVRSVTQPVCQQAVDAECACVAPKTVRSAWALVSGALEEIGLPRIKINLPAKIKNTHPFFDEGELKIFLDAIEGNELIEIPALLALHSLRKSEIMHLRYKDITKTTITVRGSAVIDEHGLLTHKDANKTTTSQRCIPIMINRLSDLIEAQRGKPDEFVVKVHHNTIYKGINRICERNGLPLVGCHGLRHTFASLAMGKLPDRVIMQLGGWESMETMSNIYTHVSARRLAEAGSVMASIFNQTDTKTDTKPADASKQ